MAHDQPTRLSRPARSPVRRTPCRDEGAATADGHRQDSHAIGSRAEELELKAEHKQREQRRAIREQCTCVRRPEKQRAIVERLAIKDVNERRAHAQARAARTERVQAAQQLCNVPALDRDAKTKLHEGRPPAAPQTPRASWPLAPTRLVVFGKVVLDLPDDEWDALVASDHRSPQAKLWSSAVPK